MRVYEELFILKPDTVEEEVDGFVEQIQQVITNGKGTVDKTDKWGVRKLAYRVQKYNEGLYVLIQFSSTPDLVKEVERRMRVADRSSSSSPSASTRSRRRSRSARKLATSAPPAVRLRHQWRPAIPAAAAPAMPALPANPAHAAPGAPPVAAPESTEVKE